VLRGWAQDPEKCGACRATSSPAGLELLSRPDLYSLWFVLLVASLQVAVRKAYNELYAAVIDKKVAMKIGPADWR